MYALRHNKEATICLLLDVALPTKNEARELDSSIFLLCDSYDTNKSDKAGGPNERP